MKQKHTILTSTITMLALALTLTLGGCVTPPGPTIASLGPGSDAAYLNANRGRADAQMSRAQAEQYSRQREQTAEEMQLEQLKKQQTMENIQGGVNIIGSALSFIR